MTEIYQDTDQRRTTNKNNIKTILNSTWKMVKWSLQDIQKKMEGQEIQNKETLVDAILSVGKKLEGEPYG